MSGRNLEHDLEALGRKVVGGSSVVPEVMVRVGNLRMESVGAIQLRRLVMRGTIGLAACVAIGFFLSTLLAGPKVGFAAVVAKVNQTHTLRCETTMPVPGEGPLNMRILSKGDLMRVELSNGQVSVWNRSSGKMVSLNPAKKQAIIVTLARQPFDFYATLKDFKDGKEEPQGEKELNGRKVMVFNVTRPLPASRDTPESTALTLWVDPATGLPVQADWPVDGKMATYKNLQFDVAIDDKVFDMTVPADYTLQDMGGLSSEQVKPAPTTREAANTLALKPGVGVGTLRFGDSKEKVIEVMGKPEKEQANGTDLQYPSKGLYLLVTLKRGLLSLTARSKEVAGPFAMNDFAGKTDKGIGIGTPRAEIEAAYGKPTKERVNPVSSSSVYITYDELGISFTLFSGHVVSILMQPTKAPVP